MDRLRLPFDIFVSILDASHPSTIAACMLTCHTLYCYGSKPLLDCGAIITIPTDFISFLEFMHVDEEVRFQHLKSLEIASFPKASEEAMEALHKLLRHPLFSIHTLILWDAEETLKTSTCFYETTGDGFPQIISTLATLRHLTVNLGGPHTSAFIRAIRAPLETAHLNLDPLATGAPWPHYHQSDADPVLLLHACAGSLHTITGTGFGGLDPNERVILPDGAVYPRVHTLDMTYDSWVTESEGQLEWGAMPHTRRYIRGFPSLKRLVLSMVPVIFGAGYKHKDPDVSDVYRPLYRLRKANQEEVGALLRRGEVWKGLEEARGGLNDLYGLGLALEVPRVIVEGDVHCWDQHMLRDVLSDMRPTALVATFLGGLETFGPNAARRTALSYSEGTMRLAEVELVVKFRSTEGNVDVGVVLVSGLSDGTTRQSLPWGLHHRTISSGTSSRPM